jgi:hypothetical protein
MTESLIQKRVIGRTLSSQGPQCSLRLTTGVNCHRLHDFVFRRQWLSGRY